MMEEQEPERLVDRVAEASEYSGCGHGASDVLAKKFPSVCIRFVSARVDDLCMKMSWRLRAINFKPLKVSFEGECGRHRLRE